MNAKSIHLRVYDTQPDLNRYEHGPAEIHDDNLAKLPYIIYKGIPFEATGFEERFLQDISHLAACGVLRLERGTPQVDIPILSEAEYKAADAIRIQTLQPMTDYLEPALRDIFPWLKLQIPKHLEDRIVGFRKYPCYAIPMAMMKRAVVRREYDPVGTTPPMIFVIEEADGVVK